jgi:NitT/TauT family transport system ATP-binding protein
MRWGGLTKSARRARAQEALEAVGLTGVGGKFPWQLSGGMQQRVSIARALASRPALLLMDEPFASVDAQTRFELEDLLRRVQREQGSTVLVVTHDIDESVYLGDRVLVLSKSPARIVADLTVGLPAERNQITTRESAEFVTLRGEVARLLQGSAPEEIIAKPDPTEWEVAELPTGEPADHKANSLS